MSVVLLTTSLGDLTVKANAAASAMSSAATAAQSLSDATQNVANSTKSVVDPMQALTDLLAGSTAPMGQFKANADTIFALLKNGQLTVTEARNQFKALFDMLSGWAKSPEATGALSAFYEQLKKILDELNRSGRP